MNKPRLGLSLTICSVFVCSVVLLLGALAIAQHALDSNLRVGSAGRNTLMAPQVKMNRSPYYIGRSGDILYNPGVAFNSPEVYNSHITRHQKSIGMYDPRPLGGIVINASMLASPRYSVGLSTKPRTRPTASPLTVRRVNNKRASASLQRSGYLPGRTLRSTRAPTLSLQRRSFSASRKIRPR